MNLRYSNVSNEFKQECKRSVNNYEKTGKIYIVEDNKYITESDNLVDFTIEDNCYVNDKFVGTTVAKKILVNMLNPNNEIDLENKEISVSTGIIIDGTEENIPFGNFIIQKPDGEEVKEKTSFIGYDYMIKFNIPYKDKRKYPCKIRELFQDVCNQVGVEAGNLDFINSEYVILDNPFTNNEDCRTVLSNIAQLAGGFAHIGRDNKLYIVCLKNISNLITVGDIDNKTVEEVEEILVELMSGEQEKTDEMLDANNYFEDFSKNKQWGELNSLIIGLSSIEGENTAIQDEESIEENGLTELVIEDNYFLSNQEEREKVIIPLWNILNGIKYLPFKNKYYGYPYLDVGDMIYVVDTNDKGYISYVFNHTFKYDGTFCGSLDTPALTKTQTAYKNTINTKTKFKRAERKIDKINGVIEDVIEQTTENTQKLTQVEQTVDNISQRVESIEDFTKQVEANNQLHLTDTVKGQGYVLEFKVKGDTEKFKYLVPSESLVPSNNLVPLR